MDKAKTRTEIAAEFGISRRTLQRWLKKENIQLANRLVTPGEQKNIYSKFGVPKNLKNADDVRDRFARRR